MRILELVDTWIHLIEIGIQDETADAQYPPRVSRHLAPSFKTFLLNVLCDIHSRVISSSARFTDRGIVESFWTVE